MKDVGLWPHPWQRVQCQNNYEISTKVTRQSRSLLTRKPCRRCNVTVCHVTSQVCGDTMLHAIWSENIIEWWKVCTACRRASVYVCGEVYGYTLLMKRKKPHQRIIMWLDLDARTWPWSLIMTCNRASCFQIPLSYLNVLNLTSCHYLQIFYYAQSCEGAGWFHFSTWLIHYLLFIIIIKPI